MSDKPAVMFDMDGVLADFYTGYRGLQHQLGKEMTFDKVWEAYLDNAVWAEIERSHSFWWELPATVEMQRKGWLWREMNSINRVLDVYYVTARHGTNVRHQTIGWLVRHGIEEPQVICSPEKASIARVIGAGWSIEDWPKNVTAIEPHALSYLYDPEDWHPTSTLPKVTIEEYLTLLKRDLT